MILNLKMEQAQVELDTVSEISIVYLTLLCWKCDLNGSKISMEIYGKQLAPTNASLADINRTK